MKKSVLLFIVVVFAIAGCKKVFFEPEPGTDPEALFEELWTTFKTDYAPFSERNVDWDAQYQLYRTQVSGQTTPEELKEIFQLMLRSLNDGHVSLTTPHAHDFYSNVIIDQLIDDELFDLELIKSNYLQSAFEINGNGLNTYGKIGNIGYWHVSAIGRNMSDMTEILDYFADADGLIIDLRHNSGGNFTYSFSEMGRFTDQQRLVFSSKTKNGKGPDDFTDWHQWYIHPSGNYFDKPIVLITDRYTISAGERTTMAFKALPNVIHVGDTTNGAFSTMIKKELANGWFYSVATQKTLFLDGNSYEGIGMPPDIYIKNTLAEMAGGQDKTVEEALAQF